jgi:hypothetical protein
LTSYFFQDINQEMARKEATKESGQKQRIENIFDEMSRLREELLRTCPKGRLEITSIENPGLPELIVTYLKAEWAEKPECRLLAEVYPGSLESKSLSLALFRGDLYQSSVLITVFTHKEGGVHVLCNRVERKGMSPVAREVANKIEHLSEEEHIQMAEEVITLLRQGQRK